MFEDTKDTVTSQDHAAALDYAGALAIKIEGSPEQVPLTIERVVPPPKAPVDPRLLPPTKQLQVERMLDLDGKQIGLRGRALPGNAIVEFELTGLINEPGFRGWKHVSVRTEPRRGRSPRSSAKRKG